MKIFFIHEIILNCKKERLLIKGKTQYFSIFFFYIYFIANQKMLLIVTNSPTTKILQL